MKNKLLIFSVFFSFNSCTSDFNDINTNDANFTDSIGTGL